jgi:hypothetical protein
MLTKSRFGSWGPWKNCLRLANDIEYEENDFAFHNQMISNRGADVLISQ